MSTQKIIVQCDSCSGAGVYRGMAEPKGVAVVCFYCRGNGAKELSYTPFTGRKTISGVEKVSRSRGTLIIGPMGPTGSYISYQEFLGGKLPP